MRQYLALALLATTLGACGNKGALTFPPIPATPTAPTTSSAPAADAARVPAAQTVTDSNTPGDPAR